MVQCSNGSMTLPLPRRAVRCCMQRTQSKQELLSDCAVALGMGTKPKVRDLRIRQHSHLHSITHTHTESHVSHTYHTFLLLVRHNSVRTQHGVLGRYQQPAWGPQLDNGIVTYCLVYITAITLMRFVRPSGPCC